MTSLAEKLSGIVGAAFEEQGLPADLGAVRVSDRPDLCQFQCNGAMAAAKVAKKNPREIAENIVGLLQGRDEFTKIEIAGPGFINLDVTDAYIAGHLTDKASGEHLGIETIGTGQTVILDYGGMNVAKAMHVGHVRSLAIGDCLKRIYRFAGYEALGDIHMGDWGLQMGQIISEFELRHPEWSYFDPEFDGEYPSEPPFDYAELEEVYPASSQACKDDEARLEQARKATVELQEGRKGYVALWQNFIDLSIKDIKENIAPLGIDFEIWNGEACVNPLIEEIGNDLKTKGVLEASDGAWVISVARDDDNKDMPPLIYYKTDGAATYGTTDLATIYDRIKEHPNLTHMVYETDIRQKLHFEQVFRAAERAGYTDNIQMTHIGHGTINGTDGKPFKTREGKAMNFRDMVAAVVEKARTKLDEADLARDADEQERAKIAMKVAGSALKFAELSNQAHMDYIFDLDRMTGFEGKTGPYLLYQSVRIKSLLSKAQDQGLEFSHEQGLIIENEDRALALLLTELPDHFNLALKNHAPHILCDYAFKLAQGFSSFYASCHILSEENEGLRASRLALCDLTCRQLVLVLGLLGIETPERM